MGVRHPAVAGAFYSSDPRSLLRDIEGAFLHKFGPGKLPGEGAAERTITAIVCPHAGYEYSAYVAAHAYYALSLQKHPESVVILNPNHTGIGSAVSVYAGGSWETPLGRIEVDSELASDILRLCPDAESDESGHLYEHSGEVQVPFLQYIFGSRVNIVPIMMGYQDLETSRRLGEALAEAFTGRNAVVLASTDLNHQESQQVTLHKDGLVLKAIEAMDEAALQKAVRDNRITICGYGPVSAAIVASRQLGATHAEVLSHHTSGDVTGDFKAVVGYAAAKMVRAV